MPDLGEHKPLALTFDNARFTQAPSTTLDIIPAAGESDSGIIVVEFPISTDTVDVSANSGTNFRSIDADSVGSIGAKLNAVGENVHITNIGNSTGRYRIVTDATINNRIFLRLITTLS